MSGPLIENILQARIVGTKRTRDGYIDDKSGNQNPDNYGDENYALSLRWTPTDNFEFNTRGNERSYRRRMGGADAAGIVNLTENGGGVDPVTGNKRNTSSFAMGYRQVDDTVGPMLTTSLVDSDTNPACTGHRRDVASPRNAGYQNQPGRPTIYNFTDPLTGAAVTAQRVTPGVDFGSSARTRSTTRPSARASRGSTCWVTAASAVATLRPIPAVIRTSTSISRRTRPTSAGR